MSFLSLFCLKRLDYTVFAFVLCLTVQRAVSELNDTTLNGLVKTLELAIKSYKTPPPPKQTTALLLPIRPPLLPPSHWPHKEAKCCVQQLEPRVLLVPHRRSGGGPLQTASVGLRGGGALTLKGRGKGAICWDKGDSSGASGHTQL